MRNLGAENQIVPWGIKRGPVMQLLFGLELVCFWYLRMMISIIPQILILLPCELGVSLGNIVTVDEYQSID